MHKLKSLKRPSRAHSFLSTMFFTPRNECSHIQSVGYAPFLWYPHLRYSCVPIFFKRHDPPLLSLITTVSLKRGFLRRLYIACPRSIRCVYARFTRVLACTYVQNGCTRPRIHTRNLQ